MKTSRCARLPHSPLRSYLLPTGPMCSYDPRHSWHYDFTDISFFLLRLSSFLYPVNLLAHITFINNLTLCSSLHPHNSTVKADVQPPVSYRPYLVWYRFRTNNVRGGGIHFSRLRVLHVFSSCRFQLYEFNKYNTHIFQHISGTLFLLSLLFVCLSLLYSIYHIG